jgi:NAD(P)-dependent dehydrogenase (short-subunit alcohol dehydrogenase family)
MRLKGKVASITGGAHGMGGAEAQPFVKQDFDATMIFAMQPTMRGHEAWTLV